MHETSYLADARTIVPPSLPNSLPTPAATRVLENPHTAPFPSEHTIRTLQEGYTTRSTGGQNTQREPFFGKQGPHSIRPDLPASSRWCFLRPPCPRARLRTTALFPPNSELRWLLRFAGWPEVELHLPRRDATTPAVNRRSEKKVSHLLQYRTKTTMYRMISSRTKGRRAEVANKLQISKAKAFGVPKHCTHVEATSTTVGRRMPL